KDLSAYFDQWVNRKGAPSFSVTDIKSEKGDQQYQLEFKINQIQKEDAFIIDVPVAIYLEGSNEIVWKNISMDKKELTVKLEFDKKPLRIELDPQFNLMRRVDKKEVPSSLSQVYGNTKTTLVLPSKSPSLESYKSMAESWKRTQESQGKTASIVSDSDLKNIPTDQSVWVLGFENKFNTKELQTNYSDYLGKEKVTLIKTLSENGAVVYATPNKTDIAYSVGFVGANSEKAITALTGKLLHYGKYGFLGFEGDGATNVLKGSLPALDSPLNIKVSDGETEAELTPRKALYTSKRKSGRPRH
ncbi:MAG: hypothetical protein KAG37_08910, partial [Flavobacteriales bacterium]|nr:hypothetical protein [Flavobacteriales bacterium]